MKKNNLVVAATLLLLSACQTNAGGSIKWTEGGVVTGAGGNKTQLDVQGIYDNLNYAGVTYLAGFKMDDEGNNYSHIVQIGDDISLVKYWPFDQIPNDIYVYQEKIHMITTDGEVYFLNGETWKLTDKKFPRGSQVVHSDQKNDLILCYPAAMQKTGDHDSGCISTNNKWKLDFFWLTIVPKACNGKLHLVEESHNAKRFKQIDLATGETLKSELVKDLPEDICKL